MIASFRRQLHRFWAAAPVATVLLAVALAAALLFAVRASLFWADRPGRIAREQPVAAWMTPRYVAHSWQLPRRTVIEALALTPGSGPPRATLAELAADRGVPVATLIEALETAIAERRAAEPEPRSDAPAPAATGSGTPAPAQDGEETAQ